MYAALGAKKLTGVMTQIDINNLRHKEDRGLHNSNKPWALESLKLDVARQYKLVPNIGVGDKKWFLIRYSRNKLGMLQLVNCN